VPDSLSLDIASVRADSTPRGPGVSTALLLSLVLAGPAGLRADAVVVFPDDTGDLRAAVQQVDDGGVILVRPGTYQPPASGWDLRSADKAFTIRAATPGTATFDGGGAGRLIRLRSASGGRGRPVVFEGLVFANGYSDSEGQGGGVTVLGRDVTFRFCTFRDNAAVTPTTGGGAVRVADDGSVVVEDSLFDGNRTPNRGAAISSIFSDVTVRRSTFTDNRTNEGLHSPRAVGGAIYVLDGELLVQRSRFERNQAGWSGGAIYVFGDWNDAVAGPVAFARVEDTVFRDNASSPERCCLPPGPSQGGAIHVEDQARAEVVRSLFERNSGNWGGAISDYRAELEIRDSIFRGNQALLDGDFPAAGGAVIVVSADILNASVGFGAVNRPPASLVASGNFFQGAFGSVAATASQGGCLAALGDTNRQYGEGGLPLDADLARNRARVVLDSSTFLDCRVAPDAAGGQVFGGAVYSILADLEIESSMFLRSRAELGNGGALILIEQSRVDVADSVFADSYAAELGGAIHAAGSQLDVRGSTFLRNAVAKSTSGVVFEQSGSALLIQPALPRRADATGAITGNLFAGNPGIVVFEGDNAENARNLTTYGDNRFVADGARKVFLNPLASFAGSNVAELNSLVVNRSDGSSTQKSSAPNLTVAGALPFGRLLAAPATVYEDGGPAGSRPAFVAWAWEGASALLAGAAGGGAALATRSGAVDVTEARSLSLQVDGSTRDTVEVGVVSATDCPQEPCLGADRFAVDVDWRGFDGGSGTGRPVALATASEDSSVLWFFDPDNWELLVKVLDACGVNGYRWVFAAATTNVEYTLRVTDLSTGQRQTYSNPLGERSAAITDTRAFACEPAGSPGASSARPPSGRARQGRGVWAPGSWAPGSWGAGLQSSREAREAEAAGGCAATETTLCLNGGRFAVRVAWEDFTGQEGSARVVPAGGADSGLLWFFAPDNWELLVKVLDACALNGNFWVLAAATTNVGYTLTVTDTETGRTVEYDNALGDRSPAIVDVEAFPTCGA
jgi:hypothetical protein